jgi:cytochrome d ubiquinol oxidase subunit I
MTFAAMVATGFLVAGIHAFYLLRNRRSEFHRAAFHIGAALGCFCIPLQFVTGDLAARRVAELQPAKLAAMEAHYHTRARAPLVLGGIPDDKEMRVRYGIEVPAGLSLLVGRSPDVEVPGLDSIPREHWPNVAAVHWSFDIMVLCGIVMLAVALWAGAVWWRKGSPAESPGLLRAFLLTTPMGMIAIEAGWMVTELGRQPWIIYGVMQTRDAVTPMPGLAIPFTLLTAVYLFLSVVLFFVLRRQFRQTTPAVEEN